MVTEQLRESSLQTDFGAGNSAGSSSLAFFATTSTNSHRRPTKNVHAHEVPPSLRESFIFSGYRQLGTSFSQCIASLFHMHNETVNIWTHLLPGCYYLYQFIRYSREMHPDYSNITSVQFHFPFRLFLLGSALYSFTSSFAHTFNIMSIRARHICFIFDYAALAFFAHGVGAMYFAYALPSHWSQQSGWMHQLTKYFLPLSVLTSASCVIFSGSSRFLPPTFTTKLLRLSAFALPFFFNNWPVFHRIFLPLGGMNAAAAAGRHSLGLHLWLAQFLLAMLAALFYTTHVPERIWPGRFDHIGHSHQYLHVLGAFATYCQFQGARLFMLEKAQTDQLLGVVSNFEATYYSAGAVVLVNILVLAIFNCHLDSGYELVNAALSSTQHDSASRHPKKD